MTSPPVLHTGNHERMKAAVHGIALGTAALCGIYNLAAWLVRREKHLAVNVLLYGAAVFWEIEHVRHHLAARRQPHPIPLAASDEFDSAA